MRERLLEALRGLPAHRRRLASLLACSVADDPADAAAQLLEQAYPAIRASAARFLSLLRQPNERAQNLLAQALWPTNLTIRLAARPGQEPGASDPPATRWSCQLCARYNDLTDIDCRHRDNGTHPAND